MTARDHNKLLSIFYFVMGGLQMLIGIFVALVYGIFGGVMLTASHGDDDQIAGGIVLVVAIVVGLIIMAFASFTLFAGFSVFKEKPLGRILGIIVSCLVLLSFPLGTALGVYGLWFFFGDVGKNFYAGLKPGSPYPPQPPSPGTWQ
ncbi:MAG TPA: hypothetical protein VGQ55_11045 [Pyrinomonadaceae bacterium]|jgi:hypothetical protein|nr:hypothetical protein [Pyrinomonadaceae bacterium]